MSRVCFLYPQGAAMPRDIEHSVELGRPLATRIATQARAPALTAALDWPRTLSIARPRAAIAFGVALLLCMAGLVWLYLYIPAGFEQPLFWSPRPNHAVEVSALYRTGFRLPAMTLSSTA